MKRREDLRALAFAEAMKRSQAEDSPTWQYDLNKNHHPMSYCISLSPDVVVSRLTVVAVGLAPEPRYFYRML
ncbi:hypothetical protein TNCT_83151 [Trichonephila clavata]|uniref:Uncharacterized protein n=1 Tax=Trichonephila clavata TaxID=2740835 RepID=A0A8X6J367_TRICU|nr:hypothetical protein TNCT_83151 [Trichonephila clavata]